MPQGRITEAQSEERDQNAERFAWGTVRLRKADGDEKGKREIANRTRSRSLRACRDTSEEGI